MPVSEEVMQQITSNQCTPETCRHNNPKHDEMPCYGGQWTEHAPHDYQVRVQDWVMKEYGCARQTWMHCPGKTAETVLR